MESERVLAVSGCVLLLLLIFNVSGIAAKQNKLDVIKLAKPELKSGKLLMQSLKERKSTRVFFFKRIVCSLVI